MFFAIHVSRRWLVSPAARKVYSVCAALSTLLWVEVFWRVARPGPRAVLEGWTLIRILPLVIASAILTVAMCYFWVRVHSHDAFGRGLWLLVLWTGPFGAIPYFLFVYLRFPLVSIPESAKTASAGASLLN